MDRWKRPLLGSVVLGFDPTTSQYSELVIWDGSLSVTASTDGTNNTKIKTDANGRIEALIGFNGTNFVPLIVNTDGRLEVLTGFDGTNYLPLTVDTNGRLQVLSAFDGTNYLPVKSDSAGRIESHVASDGTSYIPIKVNTQGEVFTVNRSSQVVSIINQSVTENSPILPSPLLIEKNGMLRIHVSLRSGANNTKVKVSRTLGVDSVEEFLNANSPLVDDSAYIFDICVSEGEQINLIPFIDGTGTTTISLLRLIVFFSEELL